MLLLFAVATTRADSNYLSELKKEARTQQLAETATWHRLLHDRKGLFGGQKSEIDDPKFFQSPIGRSDPSSELDATLSAFFDPVPADTETQHPQCRYPARFSWLNDYLHFDRDRLPIIACPRFDAWASRMNAGSVTIVFASYYMNNPASMYGHPFIRLNAADRRNHPPLLDYTASYAADIPPHDDLLFAFKGLAGAYRGRFSTTPYYMKVREYNDMESRDLWEYDLSIDSAAVRRIIQHLWEVGQVSEAYYFFSKNCAYEMLPLLEVGDPSLNLSQRFVLKAIPADVLRALRDAPGLVTHIERRPSFVAQMIGRRALLTSIEIQHAEHLAAAPKVDNRTDLATSPRDRQAMILDSAYDRFRYRVGFEREQPPSTGEEEQRLLSARNALGVISTSTVEPQAAISPDQGHPSGRIGGLYGFSNHSHFEELSLRPATHDQDDPPKGYLPGSQLEMFHLRLRYDQDRSTAYVREFSLVHIMSLSPLDRWVRHPSWSIQTGFDDALDRNRDPENSLYYGLSGGSGVAIPTPLGKGSMLYALAKMDAGVGPVFLEGYRLGGGGEAGLLFTIAGFWQVDLSGSYTKYPIGDISGRNTLKLVQGCPLSRNLQARVTLERQNHYQEVLAGLLLYL